MPFSPSRPPKTLLRLGLISVLLPGVALAAPAPKPRVDAAGFEKSVKPILKSTCSGCHNASVMSGGVNLQPYLDPATISEDRVSWEKIVQKIESGEMPPKGVPRPPQPRSEEHTSEL